MGLNSIHKKKKKNTGIPSSAAVERRFIAGGQIRHNKLSDKYLDAAACESLRVFCLFQRLKH